MKCVPGGFRSDEAEQGAVCAFHEKGSSGVADRWWTAKLSGMAEVAVIDSRAPECSIGANITEFQNVLEEIDGTTVFFTDFDDIDLASAHAS